MNKINMSVYGCSDHFAELATQYPTLQVGRVLSQEKAVYRVISQDGEIQAKMAGKFRYDATSVSQYPAVGDFVMMDCKNVDNGYAVIHHVLDRKTAFIRKAAGHSYKPQVVAANIDIIFLCMSLNNDFNLRRLERYLSICWESKATPVVVLTKSDLCDDIEDKINQVKEVAKDAAILVTSSKIEDGYHQILPYINPQTTVALIGSSGVGKSTLINCLVGDILVETGAIRELDDKGRHTTTRRELILLPCGGLVIDTPGMRELGMLDSSEGVGKTFLDIDELSAGCKFNNCTHTNEPKCAVKQAVEDGELSAERLQSYIKLQTENAEVEAATSYKAKEKSRSKMVKTAKYNKKSRRNYED